MCISAYLEAGRVLDMPEVRAFALKSLDRVLAEAWDATTGMAHVVAYGETGAAGARVAGVLDDYVFAGTCGAGCVGGDGGVAVLRCGRRGDCGERGGAVLRSGGVAGSSIRRLRRRASRRLGALTTRRKPLQDSPTPAGNPVAAALLLRLEALNGREDYAVKALETLETFAGVVEHFGLYAASYGLALQRMVQRSVQVCVIGDDAEARRLEAVALARYAVNKSVIRLRQDQMEALPPMLAETLPHLPGLQDGG